MLDNEQLERDLENLKFKHDALKSFVSAIVDTLHAAFSTDKEIRQLLKDDRKKYYDEINSQIK